MTTKAGKRRHGAPAKPEPLPETEFLTCEVCGDELDPFAAKYARICPECGVLFCLDCRYWTSDFGCPNCQRPIEDYKENRQYPEKDIFQDA